MWNQGKSALNMNVDTGVARARAEKVMDAAARSGAALPLHQEWRPKVDTSDPKSRWIVEGTKVDPSANDPLASHLDLELAVGRPPSAMELAAGIRRIIRLGIEPQKVEEALEGSGRRREGENVQETEEGEPEEEEQEQEQEGEQEEQEREQEE